LGRNDLVIGLLEKFKSAAKTIRPKFIVADIIIICGEVLYGRILNQIGKFIKTSRKLEDAGNT